MSEADASMWDVSDGYSGRRPETPVSEYKHTMVELEDQVNQIVIQECKVDACIDWFLANLKQIPDFNRYDLQRPWAKGGARLTNIEQELRNHIDRLVPGYLASVPDILQDKRLVYDMQQRWEDIRAIRPMRTSSDEEQPDSDEEQSGSDEEQPDSDEDKPDIEEDKPDIEEDKPDIEEDQFDPEKHGLCGVSQSLLDVLMEKSYRQRSGEAEPFSPESHATFIDTCRQLRDAIVDQRILSSFACGGTINAHQSPVSIYWSTGDDSNAKKLLLPLNGLTQESSDTTLQKLVADCQPASFGRGEQEVIDPQYRKAGKLDPSHFLSSFHLSDFGIVEKVEQILLPSINTDIENELQFRKLSAELYKLNVYSGPSGLFRKHVDTPRSNNQIGSLVVCLPSSFQGGKLIVQHDGQKMEFDWSPQSGSTIQWAAFYSDCEHEIQTITEGDRVTLTYNLYLTESVGGVTQPGATQPVNSIVPANTLPLHDFFKHHLGDKGFMKEGGVLGFFCAHAYPHTSYRADLQVPKGLKGSDMVLYSVFKSIGVDVTCVPVLENEGYYGGNPHLNGKGRSSDSGRGEYSALYSFQEYLRRGKRYHISTTEMLPRRATDCSDIDRRWKTLLMARKVKGMAQAVKFAREKGLETKPNSFYEVQGSLIGTSFHWHSRTDDMEDECNPDEIVRSEWPAYYLPGITWVTEPKHSEEAFEYVAYGNEPSIGTKYSVVAILAVIPPADQRKLNLV